MSMLGGGRRIGVGISYTIMYSSVQRGRCVDICIIMTGTAAFNMIAITHN